MRISVVTDIHGNVEALARVADAAERLIILGDLLDYVDYQNPGRGILGEVFGADAGRTFARLRARGDFPALRLLNTELWSTIDQPVDTLRGIVRARYRTIADVLPPDTLLTLGNVDVAAEWTAVAGQRIPFRDRDAVAIDGVRFGFIAGGAARYRRTPAPDPAAPWRPFIRSATAYRSAVDDLDEVDVLCSHIPPDVPQLRYDIIPGRLEMAGPGLREYVEAVQPVLSLFGHVHQPLALRARLGRTECVNAGHFQRSERAYIIDTDQIRAMASAPRSERAWAADRPANRYATDHG